MIYFLTIPGVTDFNGAEANLDVEITDGANFSFDVKVKNLAETAVKIRTECLVKPHELPGHFNYVLKAIYHPDSHQAENIECGDVLKRLGLDDILFDLVIAKVKIEPTKYLQQ